ncbi:MAG: hypothetical protein ACR2RF_20665 [Geminicoccaceae bacterium]
MQVFAKRFFGFEPLKWPLVSFGLEGNRDALIAESQPGDLIAFMGTQKSPTAEEDQGRFLGIAMFGRSPHKTVDVLGSVIDRPEAYEQDGKLRWDFSVLMLRVWKFSKKPRVTDVLKQQLNYPAAVRAILLDEEDAKALLALEMEEVELPDIEIIHRERDLIGTLSGPSRGLTPSSWSGSVSCDATAASNTYALQFGNRNVWKIGHAKDVKSRLKEINAHVPGEILNESWSVVRVQRWPNQSAAFDMEQRVLKQLASCRTEGERVVCSETELDKGWASAVASA